MTHDDIKPANILLTTSDPDTAGIKLADFGRAHPLEIRKGFSSAGMTTLWYRSPEYILGRGECGAAMDAWATGCTIAEMFTLRALFCGGPDGTGWTSTEFDLIVEITQAFGHFSEEAWPGVSRMPHFCGLWPKFKGKRPEEVFGTDDVLVHDMLLGLMRYDPLQRLTVGLAAKKEIFGEETKKRSRSEESGDVDTKRREVA